MNRTANAVDTVARQLTEQLGAQVARDVASAELTTYRCGGPLAVVVRIERLVDLRSVATALHSSPAADVLVIGRGSNLLVADEGFAGIALLLALEELEINSASARVDAAGGVALPVLARRAGAAGIGGLEFFVGIPGSVGGAVRMNAGGHGADTAAVVRGARVFDLERNEVLMLDDRALGLGYRTSAVGPRMVVTAASFQGVPTDPDVCAARIDEIVRWRREHQPGGQNAGSVFTNPPGDSAGRLIDACGLKGLRVGGAVVSEKHANFFVADPGARSGDVRDLVLEVRRRVEAETGVRLEPELRLVGFPDDEASTG